MWPWGGAPAVAFLRGFGPGAETSVVGDTAIGRGALEETRLAFDVVVYRPLESRFWPEGLATATSSTPDGAFTRSLTLSRVERRGYPS